MTDGEPKGADESGGSRSVQDASPPSTMLLWRDARAELHAARAVLSEPSASSRCAAVHLVSAWQNLAALHARAAEKDPPGAEQLGAWVREAHLRPAEERERAAATLEQLIAIERREPWQSLPDAPAGEELQANTATLARALAAADVAVLDSAAHRGQRRRWIVRAAVLAVVVLTGIIYSAFWRGERTGPWHAEYSTRHTKRNPIIQRDHDIDFDWELGPPVVDIGIDRFTVRWYSCLALEADTRVTFELTSDDGSRLFVDGQMVIDNWGVHPAKTEVAARELHGGIHSLRVEYFDDHEEASVRLRAAFDDDPMGPIPTAALLYPGADFDRENPCAGVEEEDDQDDSAEADET